MAERTTIARPYAEAIFDIAKEQGNLSGWSRMLQLAATAAAHADMERLIGSPRVSKTQLVDLFVTLCGDTLNDTGRNLIRVLADNGRLGLLPEIAALYEIARADAERTVQAEVMAATQLSAEQQAVIAEALKKRLGREVSLTVSIDSSLLGGAVIRAGDLVIDGSVAGKLQKLGSALLR